MLYQARYADVKWLIEYGKDNAVISDLMKSDNNQPRIERIAYYHPSNANWNYEIGLTEIDGVTYELLTQFGTVKGGRAIYMPKYFSGEQI